MSTPVTTENSELLSNGQFADQWISEGTKGKWEMNAVGELAQKLSVGTRKGGSGAILLHKASVSSTVFGLKLTCRPGSLHQVGIVFNFVDENNFSAFCIDVHGKKEDGYSLLTFSMNEGNYEGISKQNYKGKAPDKTIFSLTQSGSDLILQFNDVPAYIWPAMFLVGKRVGLYSYKNTDAAFLSFNLIPFPILSASSEKTQRIAEVPVVNEMPITQTQQSVETAANVSSGNRITEFLGIRQPASKTEIEFTEVFTVPLDSFYSSLYQNSNLDNKDISGLIDNTDVQLLDLRVKRWYRDLKIIREDLVSARKELKRKQNWITKAEEQLNKETNDELYAALEKKLLELRSGARNVLLRINGLRDKEGLVLRELRVNGYSIVEKTTEDAIRELGYDFHIVGQAMTLGEYDPAEFEKNIDLSDDSGWNRALDKLHQQLFATKAITEKGKSLYEREKALLVDFDSCPSLVETKRQLNEDIGRVEDIKPLYENIVKEIEAEITDWESDKMTLSQQKLFYNQMSNGAPYYTNSVHIKDFFDRVVGWFGTLATPVSTEIPYPVHPKFQSDLLSNGKGCRMRLNRFIADVYANSWEQPYYFNGDKRTAIYIFQSLAINCPEIDLTFHHRVESSYTRFDYIEGFNWIANNPDWQYNGQLMAQTPDARNEFGTTQDINQFFNIAQQVCDHYIGKAKEKLEKAKQRVNELKMKISTFQHGVDDVVANGLSRERLKFIEKWNNPATNLTAAISTTIHHPDEDPLAEFLASISGHDGKSSVETYFFSPTPDGFYNQNGLSLTEFMKSPREDVICVFPVFDSSGRISTEMVKAVKNCHLSMKTPSLPTIKFVESYRVEVGWLGFGLGELSHSFNLFPGESKELVIEKTTKLSTKISETNSSEETTSTHLTSSFEDNLQNELSLGEKAAQENSSMNKNDSSQSNSNESTSSFDFSLSQSASGGIAGIATAKAEIGFKYGSNSKQNSAYSASQSAEMKRASNQSKDILSKNISNAVHKVASDTSKNNKLAFTAVSSREYEESTTNREVIKLQNPNVGKTINYNFFQVQNLYGVTTKLIDVQVVIDSGVEMVKGTGINDVRVYDLEEFGKIYANSEGSDRAAALASIIARQVFKHYGDFAPGITSGNGSVAVRNGGSVDKEMLEVLNFSSEESETVLKERIAKIKTALGYLKGVPFVLREKILSQEATVAVNCAAYHMESQLGFLPATEMYLEDRREIEKDKQRALVEQVKAQTKAGVFFQELPGGVTTLNLSEANSHEKKENPI